MALSLSFIASVIPEAETVAFVNGIVDTEVAKLQVELTKLVNEGLAKVAGGIPILSGVDSPTVQTAADGFVASEVAKLSAEIKVLVKEGLDKVYGVTPSPTAAPAAKA